MLIFYCEQFYATILENVDEMDKILKNTIYLNDGRRDK